MYVKWVSELVMTQEVMKYWGSAFCDQNLSVAFEKLFHSLLFCKVKVSVAREYIEIFEDCRPLRIPRFKSTLGQRMFDAVRFLEQHQKKYFRRTQTLLPSQDKVRGKL